MTGASDGAAWQGAPGRGVSTAPAPAAPERVERDQPRDH
jgi:hypothetical protein